MMEVFLFSKLPGCRT